MGYWEGLDRVEARRVRALPWPRRVIAHAMDWGLPLALLAAAIALAAWWRW